MSVINHVIKEENGCLYPNELRGWFFPNWFEKEHFETFMGRDLTDEEFEVLKEEMVEDLDDEVSDLVADYLNRYGEEILKERRAD